VPSSRHEVPLSRCHHDQVQVVSDRDVLAEGDPAAVERQTGTHQDVLHLIRVGRRRWTKTADHHLARSVRQQVQLEQFVQIPPQHDPQKSEYSNGF